MALQRWLFRQSVASGRDIYIYVYIYIYIYIKREREGACDGEAEGLADGIAAVVVNIRTTTSQKCEAVPRRARI